MGRIFISYRREDSESQAGRLADRLREHFGPAQIFMDVDTIEPGQDFVETIERAVGSCDAVIALIGTDWLTVTDEEDRRRIDDPADFIHLEIATALNRNIRVIPVLVRRARMPRAKDLPESLAKLARRQAIEVSDSRFRSDVEHLVESLERLLHQESVTDVRGVQPGASSSPTEQAGRDMPPTTSPASRARPESQPIDTTVGREISKIPDPRRGTQRPAVSLEGTQSVNIARADDGARLTPRPNLVMRALQGPYGPLVYFGGALLAIVLLFSLIALLTG